MTDEADVQGTKVTDDQGPVTDHAGPVEDFAGKVTDHDGPVTDSKEKVVGFSGPVVDDETTQRLCTVEGCGRTLHRVKFMKDGVKVNTDDYCMWHGPVGDPMKCASPDMKAETADKKIETPKSS